MYPCMYSVYSMQHAACSIQYTVYSQCIASYTVSVSVSVTTVTTSTYLLYVITITITITTTNSRYVATTLRLVATTVPPRT